MSSFSGDVRQAGSHAAEAGQSFVVRGACEGGEGELAALFLYRPAGLGETPIEAKSGLLLGRHGQSSTGAPVGPYPIQ